MLLHDVIPIVLKGLAGGSFVVLFAAVGEIVRPRGLAGISSGAPSVALASLLVTVLTVGVASARNQALGMVAGAAALVVWCLAGTETVKRFGALRGSVAATAVWFSAACGLWAVTLR